MIDADACPKAIKEIIFKASERLKGNYLGGNPNIAKPRSLYKIQLWLIKD